MLKKDLISAVTASLSGKGYRKSTPATTTSLSIIDESGNKGKVKVDIPGYKLRLNKNDVEAVIDEALRLIVNAISLGENINLPDFGKLYLVYRAAGTKVMFGKETELKAACGVKFSPFEPVRNAAELYVDRYSSKFDFKSLAALGYKRYLDKELLSDGRIDGIEELFEDAENTDSPDETES